MSTDVSWMSPKKIWEICPVNNLSTGLPFPLGQILHARGMSSTEARTFIENPYPHPWKYLESIPGLQKARDMILAAFKNHQRLVVYGDYDVDGITSAVLLTLTLKNLGLDVRPYIPSRFLGGYGLNPEMIHYFAQAGIDLIITVDCGIRSVKETELAHQLGMEIIITDHHLPGNELPECLVINPKLTPEHACYDLAGVGVAYALANVLDAKLSRQWGLQLLTLGTLADIVPLTGINRSLVQCGLEYIRKIPIPALTELAKQARIDIQQTTSREISFMLAPRLNAAGRIKNAWDAYLLLSREDPQDIQGYARALEKLNRERQTLSTDGLQRAKDLLQDAEKDSVLVVVDESFNPGVVGLIAGNLNNRMGRPAFVGYPDEDGLVKMSARSPEGFNIVYALESIAQQHPEVLLNYGGHARAAGMTLEKDQVNNLRFLLQEQADKIYMGQIPLPILKIDLEVDLKENTLELLSLLNWLEPFGAANPEPLFVSRDVSVIDAQLVGKNQNHLRLTLQQGTTTLGAIAFHFGDQANQFVPGNQIDVVYSPILNPYDGDIQLRIEDMRRTGQ